MVFSTKIGFGGEVSGEAVVLGGKEIVSRDVTMDMNGKIIIFLTPPSKEILEKARFVGAIGVAVPSMHAREFEYFKNIGDLSLIVFQRFGKEPVLVELKEKLVKLSGKKVSLNGETHELKVI